MKELSYKDFMNQLRRRLEGYSREELYRIFVEWAKKLPSAERITFLAELVPPEPYSKRVSTTNRKEILTIVQDFAEEVKSGLYCRGEEEYYDDYGGYGGYEEFWDPEDQYFDEAWVEEAKAFFDHALDALRNKDYQLATEIYTILVDLLVNYTDNLPGSAYITEIGKLGINEMYSCYLRATYLSSPSDERPAKLLGVTHLLQWKIGDQVNLQSMLNAEFGLFLLRWIDVLKTKKDQYAKYLLREALTLSGGVQALAKFAQEAGHQHPELFLDWIRLLEQEKKYQEMITAAREGLTIVSKTHATKRAEIAETLAQAGLQLEKLDIQYEGWQLAVASEVTLSRLLSLLEIAEQQGILQEERTRAINIVQHASFSETLVVQTYLLTGHYKAAFDLCKNKGPVGWTYGTNCKVLVIPFLLKVLAKECKTCTNVVMLWEWALKAGDGFGLSISPVMQRYGKAMEKVICSIKFAEKEKETYLRWCKQETDKRVDAIVGNKYRKSYHKAARLLVAMGEILMAQGQKQAAKNLIQHYQQKYPRHVAFKRELEAALKLSRLLKSL
ncbi:MAG: hypothetical protein ACFFBD_27030 [Candidatus Hodarchaeota archaeon]